MGPMAAEDDKRAVADLWDCLYRKDWAGLKACLSPDAFYEDVPAPDPGARGPENVVKRLRMGFDVVERFEHVVHRTVAEGGSVLVEHTETWHFATGEKITNRFLTVHEVVDGRVTLWRDYWDLGTFMGQAPPWFLERLAGFDASEFS